VVQDCRRGLDHRAVLGLGLAAGIEVVRGGHEVGLLERAHLSLAQSGHDLVDAPALELRGIAERFIELGRAREAYFRFSSRDTTVEEGELELKRKAASRLRISRLCAELTALSGDLAAHDVPGIAL